jgi:sugar transferase (PEP-CTERM/EpsH1 system associated)
MTRPVHLVHLVYRFAAGGLENVIVQLVNGLPHDQFSHTIVALTQIDEGFAARIERDDVRFVSLHKRPGQPFAMYPQVYRLLRQLAPDVLHTCNLAALEFMPVAWAARVPLRIHAEHGWDISDPDGSNVKYQWLRRLYQRFVHRFVVVSTQLEEYLLNVIGIGRQRLSLIPNGVDTDRFRPLQGEDDPPEGFPFTRGREWVVGAVGRLEPIKNHQLLVQAFAHWVSTDPVTSSDARLVIVGDGPLRGVLERDAAQAGIRERLWLPGTRADVPELLRFMDCFVLPSRAEGTSCTLQEAMATGLRIIATDVGGNRGLLQHATFGQLVPTEDVSAMAQAIGAARASGVPSGHPARQHVVEYHSLKLVLRTYQRLFHQRG